MRAKKSLNPVFHDRNGKGGDLFKKDLKRVSTGFDVEDVFSLKVYLRAKTSLK